MGAVVCSALVGQSQDGLARGCVGQLFRLYGLMEPPMLPSSLADLPVRRGKVRDIYDLGEGCLVATDRISAFDWMLPSGIPDKGRVLTQISRSGSSGWASPTTC